MSDRAADRRRREILAEIGKIGFCLPGSVVSRTGRCGTPSCRCHLEDDRWHGPYQSWTRKVAGKTRTRNLSQDQLARYGPWFENAKRIRELLAELERISVAAMARAEGWPEPDPPPPDRRRSRPRRRGAPTAAG